MHLEQVRVAWTTLLGDDRVLGPDAATSRYGACTMGAERRIPGALLPREAGAIPSILRIAHEYRSPVYPVSTGHNWGYGTALPARNDCFVLDLSALQRISDFDPETGVVTVEPGVTQAMLADFLDRSGHSFLVPVHGGGPSCSIVGNALERGYGITPHTDHFGAVLALAAVLADGSVFRSPLPELSGAAAAPGHKWGLGPYLDGLFTQSGFGIVTSMTIALARRPETTKAMLFGLADNKLDEIVAAVRDVLRRLPGIVGGINLMNSHRVLSMTVPYPAERRGPDGVLTATTIAELMRAQKIHPWTGFGTLYGTKRVVRAAQREIARVMRPHVRELLFVTPAGVRRLNRVRRRVRVGLGGMGRKLDLLESALELLEGRPNQTALPLAYWRSGQMPSDSRTRDPARDGCGLIWYAPLVAMKADHVRRYVQFVTERTTAHGMEPLITLTSVSERCFDSTVPLLFDRADPEATLRAGRCVRDMIEVGCRRGFVPYRLGIDALPWFESQSLSSASLRQRLKASIDPDDLIAPGRYGK